MSKKIIDDRSARIQNPDAGRVLHRRVDINCILTYSPRWYMIRDDVLLDHRSLAFSVYRSIRIQRCNTHTYRAHLLSTHIIIYSVHIFGLTLYILYTISMKTLTINIAHTLTYSYNVSIVCHIISA